MSEPTQMQRRYRIGVTDAQEAELRKKEAAAAELESKRQAEIKEEASRRKLQVNVRSGTLMNMRERMMYDLLPKCAAGLGEGDDVHEAVLVLQIVERIDGLLGFCALRTKKIDDDMQAMYDGGHRPLMVSDLMATAADKGGKK